MVGPMETACPSSYPFPSCRGFTGDTPLLARRESGARGASEEEKEEEDEGGSSASILGSKAPVSAPVRRGRCRCRCHYCESMQMTTTVPEEWNACCCRRVGGLDLARHIVYSTLISGLHDSPPIHGASPICAGRSKSSATRRNGPQSARLKLALSLRGMGWDG